MTEASKFCKGERIEGFPVKAVVIRLLFLME